MRKTSFGAAPLMALVIASSSLALADGERKVTVDPKDVQVSIDHHLFNNDVRIVIQGQAYVAENNSNCGFENGLYSEEIEAIAKDIQGTVLSATSSHRAVVIDLTKLDRIRDCQHQNSHEAKYSDGSLRDENEALTDAFKVAGATPEPQRPSPSLPNAKKRLSGYIQTETPLRNVQLRFCVTAHFAPGIFDKICPGASFNELGQANFTADFTVPVGQTQVVAYEYELFTSESASPLAPSEKDLFSDPDVKIEQHANLGFRLIQPASPSVEAHGRDLKHVPSESAHALAASGKAGSRTAN